MIMAMTHVNASCCCFLSPTTKTTTTSSSYLQQRRLNTGGVGGGGAPCLNGNATSTTQNSFFFSANFSNKRRSSIPILRSTTSSNSADGPNPDDASAHTKKPSSFGYSRKDVILIGVGLTLLGIALKTGLEFAGVDPLQAGNVVQLVLVLGLTVGWISTYIFRVSNKEMTYAQQLRNYESKVMEKRLESLTEAELEVLLQEVEEEKSR